MKFRLFDNEKFNTLCGCLIIIYSIGFALYVTKMQKEGLGGYKTDNRQRVRRIFAEIPPMIEPYVIMESSSYTQGPRSVVTFQIDGNRNDLEKIDILLEQNGKNLGFNKSCRDHESLIATFNPNREKGKIDILWEYPSQSCG